ncbi:MAG: cohesin domain-containing protein, partial [bacterium]|nr:cohesin domain-containing protein [bacterium]
FKLPIYWKKFTCRDTSYTFHQRDDLFSTDHSLTLTNLKPGTIYHFRVGGKDNSGNGPQWSQDVTFQTKQSEVTVGLPNVSVQSNSIFWLPLQTSEITNFNVQNWEAIIAYDTALFQYVNIDQSASLTENWNPIQVFNYDGLLHLKANGSSPLQGSGDLVVFGFSCREITTPIRQSEIALLNFFYDDGYPAVSLSDAQITITGSADQQPPQIIWGPYVDHITNNSARIFWQTDELCNATVEYGTSTNYGLQVESDKLDSLHQIVISDLEPGTLYHYHLKNKDTAGNNSQFTSDSTFSTLTGSSVLVSIPTMSASAGQTIDLPLNVGNLSNLDIYSADIEIVYDDTKLTVEGLSNSACLSSVWGEPIYTTFPGLLVIAMGGIEVLRGSGSLVKVKFKVSADAQDGEFMIVRIKNFTFNEGTPLTTLKFGAIKVNDTTSPELISGPFVINLNPKSVLITWQTNEPADSRLKFGISSVDEKEISDGSFRYFHSILVDGLSPNTTYQYRVASKDSAGNDWNIAQINQFTTSTIQQIKFTISNYQADQGQNFWLPVNVSGVSSRFIFSLDFDLSLDGNVLSYQDFDLTSYPATTNWQTTSEKITDGLIRFHLHGEQPITQDGEIFKYLFSTNEATYGSASPIRMQNISVNGDTSNIVVENGLFRLIDLTPPAFLAPPVVSQVRETSAHISWQTNELTVALLAHGKSGAITDTTRIEIATVHTHYTITGLQPVTTYQFNVGITDTSGNGPVWSNIKQFTTTQGDEIEIFLPDTTVAIGDTILLPINISESTNIPISEYSFNLFFNTQKLTFIEPVQAGCLTESWNLPNFSLQQDSLKLSHISTDQITQSGILLFLKFISSNKIHHDEQIDLVFHSFILNNGAPPAAITNGVLSFIDQSAPVFREIPTAVEIGWKSATIKVWANEPCFLKIEYGTTTGLGDEITTPQPDTLHLITLSDLLPNQNYYYQVTINDSLNNGPTKSDILTFHTQKSLINISLPDTSIDINSDFLLP